MIREDTSRKILQVRNKNRTNCHSKTSPYKSYQDYPPYSTMYCRPAKRRRDTRLKVQLLLSTFNSTLETVKSVEWKQNICCTFDQLALIVKPQYLNLEEKKDGPALEVWVERIDDGQCGGFTSKHHSSGRGDGRRLLGYAVHLQVFVSCRFTHSMFILGENTSDDCSQWLPLVPLMFHHHTQ